MARPPADSSLRGVVTGILALSLFVTPAAAVQQPGPETSPAVDAVVAMLISLVVGGGLITLAREYTERTTQRIHDRTGEVFLVGLLLSIVSAIVIVLLALTVVGLLVVIPILIGLIVVGELGYLAVGRVFTDSWELVLLIAVATSALVGGIPVVGVALGLVLSSLGLGAAYLDYRADESETDSRAGRTHRSRSPPR